MNGDARSTNRLNKPEKLFIFRFFTITECTVAVDDQMSGPRIECENALGRLNKARCHVYAFMLALLDWCARPLRPRVDARRIDTDMSIGQ